METYKISKTFTGLKDLDKFILNKLDDSDLLSTCLANKYLSSVCDNSFFQQRFIQKFPNEVNNKPDNISWKKYYLLTLIKNVEEYTCIGNSELGSGDITFEPFIFFHKINNLEKFSFSISNKILDVMDKFKLLRSGDDTEFCIIYDVSEDMSLYISIINKKGGNRLPLNNKILKSIFYGLLTSEPLRQTFGISYQYNTDNYNVYATSIDLSSIQFDIDDIVINNVSYIEY